MPITRRQFVKHSSAAAAARTNLETIVAVYQSHRIGGAVKFPLKDRRNPLTVPEKQTP